MGHISNSWEVDKEFPKYYSSQFEIFLDLKNDVERPRGNEEYYDELWLSGIECCVAKILNAMDLSFNIVEVTIKQWYGAMLLRHGLPM